MAQGSNTAFTRERISAVEQTIRPHIRRTPVVELDGSDLRLRPFPLTLKLERCSIRNTVSVDFGR